LHGALAMKHAMQTCRPCMRPHACLPTSCVLQPYTVCLSRLDNSVGGQ
jgi:hypothetical protein